MVRWLRILALLMITTRTTEADTDSSPGAQPRILRRSIVPGKIVALNVGLNFATAIRLPETVSSVVVGDPARFKVEHSEKEPRMVFVKPINSDGAAQSNLLISTVAGRSISVLVRSEDNQPERTVGNDSIRPVHLVLDLLPEKGFLIEEASPSSSLLVAETVPLENANSEVVRDPRPARTQPLIESLLESQRKSSLPSLRGNLLGAGISQVYANGQEMFVLFSVVNHGKQTIELLPPQVQLAGTRGKGRGSVEQISVGEYRLTRRRLGAGERADGVVNFDRPSFKQSYESYFLQLAESAAIDRPTLTPIDLGRSLFLNSEGER